jgi:hypothetical protein
VRKSTSANTTTFLIPLLNSGTVTVLQGTLALNGGFTPTGGALGFGLSSLGNFGRIAVGGNATLTGAVSVVWLGGFVPALSNSFPVLTYGSSSGTFSNINLPPAAQWQANYAATAFSLLVTDVNRLVFVNPPAGTNAGAILSPVVVQAQDSATGNPVATNGLPVALALASGSGALSGTLTQTTDSNGRATFTNLRINVAGAKSLQASAPTMTPATSSPLSITSAAAAQLGFINSISSPQMAATAFSPRPVVQVQDQFGNVISNSTAVINALVASGGGGTLGGATSAFANGTNGSAIFNNLIYNLAQTATAEQVSISFSSPGLAPVTNPVVLVAIPLSQIILEDRNSLIEIDATTERGMFSWLVDGTNQLYQHWFWLGVGSNAPQTSIDNLGMPWGLLSTSNHAVLNYLTPGLSVQVGFSLRGGTTGSEASDVAETITVQNTTNVPISLHFFDYADFDLANDPVQDTVSIPTTNTVVQQGKGLVLTQTIQTPLPSYWEANYYAITLDKLEGPAPVRLTDSLNSAAPGDQTFAYQWDTTLGTGQSLFIILTNSIRTAVPPQLSIALVGGNVVISWPTSGAAAFKLQATDTLGPPVTWNHVTNLPTVVNGLYQVAVPPAGSAQFYRLAE